MEEYLNILDEGDHIIGTESRKIIHEEGLLHREIHVYFVTPKKEIIFQKRAEDKDTFPDLLDATVGGHVEIGDSYEETAIKETLEETGIRINSSDLIAVDKKMVNFYDEVTGKINHAFQKEFIYVFKGDVDDLKIEVGKAVGFEIWPIEKLSNMEEMQKFIPYVYDFAKTRIVEFINNNL